MSEFNPNFSNLRYSVYPRYTAGSPAGVPQETAERVAAEEKDSFKRYLTGVYGEQNKAMAERLGLGGIAEAVWERYNKLYFEDLITGEKGLKKNRLAGG